MLADAVFDVHGKTAFDREVTLAIEGLHSPSRDRAALAVSFLGDHRFLLPATLAVTAALVFGGRRVSALLFFGVVIGGWLLETLLKIVYHRARPDLWPALATEKTYSFPSGHATMSTLFYGAAAALVLHLSRNRVLRGAALALATTRRPLGLLHADLPGRALGQRRRRRNPRRPLLGQRLRHRHGIPRAPQGTESKSESRVKS